MMTISVPIDHITNTAVLVFLKGKVRCGLGERDVGLVQGRTDVWRERYGRKVDQLLECGYMINPSGDRTTTCQEREMGAHLEGLDIPVLDFLDGGHVAQIVGKFIEFFGTVRQSDRELLFPCKGLLRK